MHAELSLRSREGERDRGENERERENPHKTPKARKSEKRKEADGWWSARSIL